MPIYEYRCEDCGHELEKLQKMSADPLTACPACGKDPALKKIVSKTSFHLKGSGWYVTDYKGKSTGTEPASSSDSSSKSDSGSSSKSDSSSSKSDSGSSSTASSSSSSAASSSAD